VIKMRISIGSGKGGVGKTFFASSFISHLSKKNKLISIDGDVDAPNLALGLGITNFNNKKEIFISKAATINTNCTLCMKCVDICNFDAIHPPKVDKFLCEGCGACSYVCPANAIEIKKRKTGEILWTDSKYGYVTTAQLEIGCSNSGMLVDEEKKISEKIIKENSINLSVIDVPAGISCTTISSVSGSNYFIGIVEPTPQSLNDLERILKIVNHFGIPFFIIINKFDLNEKFSKKIENNFKEKILGKISFDMNVPKSISQMKPIIEIYPESPASKGLKNIFKHLDKLLNI